MINLDDLDPPHPVAKPLDLTTLSIEDLKNYISTLQDEIKRAQAAIEAKQSHRSGADALFKF